MDFEKNSNLYRPYYIHIKADKGYLIFVHMMLIEENPPPLQLLMRKERILFYRTTFLQVLEGQHKTATG